MTVLFVGLEDIDATTLTGHTFTTATAAHDGTYSRGALYNSTASAVININAPSGISETELWCHFTASYLGTASKTFNEWLVQFTRSGGVAAGLYVVSSNYELGLSSVKLGFDDGTGVITYGESFVLTNTANYFDIRTKISGSNILVQLYADRNLVRELKGTLSSPYTMNNLVLGTSGAAGANAGWGFSQIVLATTPTLGWLVMCKGPNANGTDSGWTGSYTTIDETINSDSDIITTILTPRRKSVTTSATTAPAGTEVKALAVSTRGRTSGVVSSYNHYVKKSGVQYDKPNKAPSSSYAGFQDIWEVDPATGVKWTTSDIGNATLVEVGCRADT